MYQLVHVLSMALCVLFNTYYGYKLGLSKAKAALSTTVSLMFLYVLMLVLAWVESGFKNFGAQNMVRTYAFAPLVFILLTVIFRIDFRKVSDLHAVWPMLMHGVSHFACIAEGCCTGYTYRSGTLACTIANALTGTNTLPQQALESVAALLIGAVIFFIARKKKFDLHGRLFYVMIIIYGINRFLWEFLRNNEKIVVFGELSCAYDGVFGLSSLSFHCLLMIAVGVAFLLAFHISDKKKEKERVELAA